MYQQINLYQPIFRKQRQIFSARTMAKAAAAVVLGLGGLYAYGYARVAGLEAEAEQLRNRERALIAQTARFDVGTGRERSAALERQHVRLKAELAAQRRRLAAGRAHPHGATSGFSAALAALGRQHATGVWLTDIAIDGSSRRIELAGASIGAELVPEYLERLGSDAALAEQTFERLEIERADDGSVRFRVTSKAVADGRRGEHAAGSAR
jgi:hypothetical protein